MRTAALFLCVLSTIRRLFVSASSTPANAGILDVGDLNTDQIQALDRTRTVVLLEGGILEEHGPYLPSFSDGYQSGFIANRVAGAIVARPGWTVLRFPPLPLGAMPANEIGGRFTFPGSYPVRMATLRAVYMDSVTVGSGRSCSRPPSRRRDGEDARKIVLMTFSFQAPAFYERHGFEVVATIDNHPHGHRNLLMRKGLRPQDVFIRPARLDEQKILESLQRRASLNNPGDRDALLASPDAIELPLEQIAEGCVFVAEREGVLTGFAAVVPRSDGGAELDALFVEPRLWKCGIGRRLVDHIADVARARKASFLHVIGNPHAEGFYISCGFRATGTIETRFGLGLDMRRPL